MGNWEKLNSSGLCTYQSNRGCKPFNAILSKKIEVYHNHNLFQKGIFEIGLFHLIEQIRIVDAEKRYLFYDKFIAIDVKPSLFYGSGILNRIVFQLVMIIYHLFDFFYKRSEKLESGELIKNSNYMKYNFVENLFTDVVRNKKLESLGIV